MGRVLLFLSVLWVAGCVRREGMNFDCRWPPDRTFAIDLQAPAHLDHLLDDIRVAEELEIRHGDAMGGRRPASFLGIVVRRGIGAGRAPEEVRAACFGAMLDAIADTHSIPVGGVRNARSRLNDTGVDWPVSIPMLALFLWLSHRAIGWIERRFLIDEKAARALAIGCAALMISASTLLIGVLWSAAVTIVRVGNAHVSYRAARGLGPSATGSARRFTGSRSCLDRRRSIQ